MAFGRFHSLLQMIELSQDSPGFWIPRRGFRILGSLSEKLGFWIPIFFQVFLSWIPDSKAQDFGFREQIFQDSGFHKQKFSLFRNPDSLARGDS